MPTFAYLVSGEYMMVETAAAAGYIDGERVMMESLLAFKRAGCDGILTCFAPRVAEVLKQITDLFPLWEKAAERREAG